MIQQSMRLKILILPLSLVIAVIVAIFFIKPALSGMSTIKDSLGKKEIQLKNLKNQTQNIQGLKSKFDTLEDERILVASAIPEKEDIDYYISEISSKASRSGVLLLDIKSAQKNSSVGVEGKSAYICGASQTGSAISTSDSPASQNSSVQPSTPQTSSVSPIGTPGKTESTTSSTSLPGDCLKDMDILLTVKGSWDQTLEFFKYLEDMNRISNISAIKIDSKNQSQSQSSTGILTTEVSLKAFFKEKNASGGASLAGDLSSQGDFNQKAIEKLGEVIYAPYSAPPVSPGGQRNMFE